MATFTDDEKATIRRLLELYREVRGYSYEGLAQAAHMRRGSGGHLWRVVHAVEWKGLSPQRALDLHAVLRFGDVRDGDQQSGLTAADHDAWMQATHVAALRQAAPIGTEAQTTPAQSRQKQDHPSASPRHHTGTDVGRTISLAVPLDELDELVAVGVDLAQRDRASAGGAVLRYLVDPYWPKGALMKAIEKGADLTLQTAATVASAHLGHAYLNQGDFVRAGELFQQAIDLLTQIQEDTQYRRVWERWYTLTHRSPMDFELWCAQMLGVVGQHATGKAQRMEARNRLTMVAQNARFGQLDPRGIRGNALRDLATLTMVMSPTAPEAKAAFDESAHLLADSGDDTMLAITLLRRARWYKRAGQIEPMERDALAGLELENDPQGTVHVNILNTIAELYQELEPVVARRFAHIAHAIAQERGLGGQLQRAEATLAKVAEGQE